MFNTISKFFKKEEFTPLSSLFQNASARNVEMVPQIMRHVGLGVIYVMGEWKGETRYLAMFSSYGLNIVDLETMDYIVSSNPEVVKDLDLARAIGDSRDFPEDGQIFRDTTDDNENDSIVFSNNILDMSLEDARVKKFIDLITKASGFKTRVN